MEYNKFNSEFFDGAVPSNHHNVTTVKRPAATLKQIIACMLTMLIIGGALGAGTVYYLNQPNESATQDSFNNSDDDFNALSEGVLEDSIAPAFSTSGDSVNAEANAETIQNFMSTVVGIEITIETKSTDFFGYTNSKTATAYGSGVIISEDGYIATNHHVIAGASSIKVYLYNGTEYTANLIGSDVYTDLAVIKIEASGLPAATIGRSSNLLVGTTVYAVGNPTGVLNSSLTDGIISGLDRVVVIDDIQMTLMQTNAAVNPGNSGGGLFDKYGTLIGIVNAKKVGTDLEGLGFAIPIDSAMPILGNLIEYGYVTSRPYLGITPKNISIAINDLNNSFGYPFSIFGQYSYVNRVQVAAVEKDGAAEIAGIKVGDIIISIDETEINGSADLTRKLYEYKVGDTVKITLQRDDKEIELAVILKEKNN